MKELKNNVVRVGIADASVVIAPGSISTVGLGSCVGITLYDEKKKIAMLAHIMLPDSTVFSEITNPYKYADLAVPLIIRDILKLGVERRNIKAKIVGGASMFKFADEKMNSNVGLRNIKAVEEILKKEKINLISKDVGGSKGRTMIVDPATGEVTIKLVGGVVRTI